MDLANDTALITGSSGGIGEEFAHPGWGPRASAYLVLACECRRGGA
jgi:NAD(P)-dependent dehydrogenase (short-subunit alcohol dehydrogenase family)